MSKSTAALSTQAWSPPNESELSDSFGTIEPLRPKVVARAQRVLAKTHGNHPLDELLAYCGLTEGDIRV